MMERTVSTGALLLCVVAFVGCKVKVNATSSVSVGFSPAGMDFDRDGRADECLVEQKGTSTSILVRLASSTSDPTRLATVERNVSHVIVCDYDGDEDLDVVYAVGPGKVCVMFIPQLDGNRPLSDQTMAWLGQKRQVAAFDDLGAEVYLVSNQGGGKFASPQRILVRSD